MYVISVQQCIFWHNLSCIWGNGLIILHLNNICVLNLSVFRKGCDHLNTKFHSSNIAEDNFMSTSMWHQPGVTKWSWNIVRVIRRHPESQTSEVSIVSVLDGSGNFPKSHVPRIFITFIARPEIDFLSWEQGVSINVSSTKQAEHLCFWSQQIQHRTH